MQTTKKKPSLIFILVGAVLAGYLGYLINGAWAEGIAFNEFMDRFKWRNKGQTGKLFKKL